MSVDEEPAVIEEGLAATVTPGTAGAVPAFEPHPATKKDKENRQQIEIAAADNLRQID